MAARRLLTGAALALIALSGHLACGYSPNPESGKLKCGRGQSCPEGYSCTDGLTCWKNMGGPDGGGSDVKPADGGGDGPTVNPAEKFIGRWVFGSGATQVIACSDGTGKTEDFTGDFVDVMAGTGGVPLRAEYFCFWNLDVGPAGNATVIRQGTTCSRAATNDPTMMFTWHGQSFTITTANGRTGTLSASIPYDYQSATGSATCTMQFSASLSKS